MPNESINLKPLKINGESTVDSVVSSIRDALSTGMLNPGDRIPSEAVLVQELGVSRSTVREAMKVLQAYGVVDIKQGNGTFITKNCDDVSTKAFIMRYTLLQPTEDECWQFRVLFEELITRNAILNAGPEDIRNMQDNLRKMKMMRANSAVTAKLDVEFHLLLGKLTPNRLIRSTYAVAISFLEPTFCRNHSIQNHVDKTIAVHSKTIDYIVKKDSSEAAISDILKMNENTWLRNP
jgi:GntR family transcriptional regulator, transcriptional repressor for pyruvate dehydrogenase complex